MCCRFIRLTINLCPNCSLSKPYTSEHDNGDKKQSDFIVDKYQQCSVQCYYSEKCKVFSSVVLILVIAHRPSHRDGGVQATIKSTLVQELRTSRMVVPKVKPFRPYNQIGPLCLVYCVFYNVCKNCSSQQKTQRSRPLPVFEELVTLG